jgi:DNA-binding beta-propeller fold protein YncE
MSRSRTLALGLLSLLLALPLSDLLQAAPQEQAPSRRALPAATRGPVRILFTPSGDRALVSESDTGTVAIVDAAAGTVRRRISTGGRQPLGLALSGDSAVVVANSFSGSVALMDLESGKQRAFLPLRGEPSEVVLSRDGKTAYVSLAELDEVAVLELPGLRLRTRVKVGRRPRAMALTPDGRTLLAANFQGGDVSLIDTTALRETRRIRLTGVNLRGIAVAADGRSAYVTGQIPANTRRTSEPLDIWTNTVFALDLGERPAGADSEPRVGAEGWLDFPLASSPDPDGIVALGPDAVAVTLSGSDEALRVRAPGPRLRTYDPQVEGRAAVGARPRGLALTPNGREIWVANELDSTLSVLDASTLRPLRRIDLGIPSHRDLRLEGRYLFGNASLTRGHQFTCNSCHPDGNTDGLTWEFAHIPDGLTLRNTRNLRGGITQTGPFRWTGYDEDVEAFFQEEITGLLHGPRQEHPALHALWNLVDQFPMPPNPYRAENGRLTPEAQRGKRLFDGKAGCLSCHDGELYGGTGRKAWIGTTPPGLLLDVPHLHGVFDTAPYLHDGRAETLESIFTTHNGERRHGKASLLSPQELAALLRYVREL